jgi:hypothetical protein
VGGGTGEGERNEEADEWVPPEGSWDKVEI